MSVRAAAAKVLAPVMRQEASLQNVFDEASNGIDETDKAFFHSLVYGVLREYEYLEAISNKLLSKKIKRKDYDVFALILCGLYQIQYMRTPDHAAISETVQAAIKLKKPWAKNLLNAVLRNYLRQQQSLQSSVSGIATASARCPAWILNTLQNDWPEHWQKINKAMRQQAPLTLRNNALRQTRSDLLTALKQDQLELKACDYSEQGFHCNSSQVLSLDAFHNGHFSVQDEAAQLSASLLELNSGQRVLDACAAPGGKSAHIVETEAALKQLLCLEIDARRAPRISENFKRLQIEDKLQLKIADAGNLDSWWDKQTFDRILLDAPCSATGIMRRHPDIKRLRTADDIKELNIIQAELLNTLWQCLKPGGILVYATCSIFKKENEEQIAHFLQTHVDASELSIDATWGEARPHGRQLFPQIDAHDGFYYARLQKAV